MIGVEVVVVVVPPLRALRCRPVPRLKREESGNLDTRERAGDCNYSS